MWRSLPWTLEGLYLSSTLKSEQGSESLAKCWLN